MHEVLRRLAKGGASNLEVLDLSGNALGGTITSDVGVFTKLKELNLSTMGLGGKICRTQHTCVVWLSWQFHCFAGELPKELGNLVNLTDVFLNDNEFQGKLYVSTYTRCMFC